MGWHVARALSEFADVWVVTRANNRVAIERALETEPSEGLRFVYLDLPDWARWWKRGNRGVQLYYYLWQAMAFVRARALHREQVFDVAHHVTFAKYWAPSFLAGIGIPYIWGPVGGGESTPEPFIAAMSARGRIYERARVAARRLAELDPWVRRTARLSSIAFATGPETAARLHALGATDVRERTQVGLSAEELARLSRPPSQKRVGDGVRFVSVGRMIALKGFDLGIRAFARSAPANADYWLIGEGPERVRLVRLAAELGVEGRVHFLGWLSREETFDRLTKCDALIHPSLHDTGGLACLESMAAGKPVICLALGGPGLMVTPETGRAVPAVGPAQAVDDLADAMRELAGTECRDALGRAARRRASTIFGYASAAKEFARAYESLRSPIERVLA